MFPIQLPAMRPLHSTPPISQVSVHLFTTTCSRWVPFKSTWLPPSKPATSCQLARSPMPMPPRHCPDSSETIRGTSLKQRKGIRSTKPKPPQCLPVHLAVAHPFHRELHIVTEPISKLYTRTTWAFPHRSAGGNQYIMLAYHCDNNAILVEPFQDHPIEHKSWTTRPAKTIARLSRRDWKATYQLVPPNASAPSKPTSSAFSPVLTPPSLTTSGTSSSHKPNSHSTSYNNPPLPLPSPPGKPSMAAQLRRAPSVPWGATSSSTTKRNKKILGLPWRDGFSIGPALHHYRCFQVVDSATNCVVISDTVEFRHSYLNQPAVTYADRLLHAINYLSSAAGTLLCPRLATPSHFCPRPISLPTGTPRQHPNHRCHHHSSVQHHPRALTGPNLQGGTHPCPCRHRYLSSVFASSHHTAASATYCPMHGATPLTPHATGAVPPPALQTSTACCCPRLSNQSVSAFAPTKLATSVLDTDTNTGLSLDYKQLRTTQS
eukprot:CCRYP_011213-RA/>CCRYP_011213-RA protein AED:0.40 eAED:0.28 QI:0/0/0/1/0/0/3/0/488